MITWGENYHEKSTISGESTGSLSRYFGGMTLKAAVNLSSLTLTVCTLKLMVSMFMKEILFIFVFWGTFWVCSRGNFLRWLEDKPFLLGFYGSV